MCDDSEEGSWANGQSAPVAVHLGEECWDSESKESEEGCEFTDGEDEGSEFHENGFQKLFAGANNISATDSNGPSVEM